MITLGKATCFILLVLLSLPTIAVSQNDVTVPFVPIGKELIVGETDTVGTFIHDNGFPCSVTFRGQAYTHSPNDPKYVQWYISSVHTNYDFIKGFGIFTPTKTGNFLDTALYNFYRVSISGSCWGGTYRATVYASFTVRNDSLVRTRPTYVFQDMVPDTLAGGWKGIYNFKIDNNTGDTVRFSDCRIRKDSLRKVSAIVKDSGSIVTEVTLLPYERWKTLSAEITAQRGPIYQDTTIRSVVSCTVSSKGKDTTHNILTDLRYKTAPYSFSSTISSKSASFSTSPNNIDSAVFLIGDDSKTVKKIVSRTSHPFSYRVDSISTFESKIVVTCAPLTGGLYIDTLKVYYDVADFNGDLRKDSLSVLLTCVSSSDNDKSEWHSTHYPLPFAKQLAVTGGGVLLAEGDDLWLSKNYGNDWGQLSTPHDSTPQLGIYNDSIYVYGKNKLMVSTNSGNSWTDRSDSVGEMLRDSYHYNQFNYVEFPIHNISTNNQGGIVVSGEFPGYFDYYRCYFYVWLVRKFDPLTLKWETSNFREGSCVSLGSTGHLKENILYLDYYGNVHYIFDEKFPVVQTHFTMSTEGVNYFSVNTKGIFRSTDQRKSWVKTGLYIDNVVGMVALDSGNIYVATKDNGIYHSSDYGENWYGMNGGLGTTYINDLKSYPGEPLYIATNSGVYRSNISTQVLSVASKTQIEEKEISIVPNPASDKLTISLLDGVLSKGLSTIFDVYGRKLLTAELQEQGTLTIDVHELINGTYFIQIPTNVGLKVGKFSITK
jgi:hypothetical protein